MPTTLSLPRISTNVRFAASALLFPELAGLWAERMFLTPPRNGAAAALDLIDARARLFEHKGRHIATWRWGSADAPLVILAHGWGGYAAQMRRFARWHWMPEAVRRAMQAAIEERYGVLWDDLEVSRLAPRLRTPALVIHDRDDRHVPWTQGAHVARIWPGARFMSTDGLGHGR